MECKPDPHADDDIQRIAADADSSHQHHEADAEQPARQGKQVQSTRVADGDDQNRTDVIGDGQRQQENPQAMRHARSHDGQAAYHEGDVRGHGDAPAALTGPTRLEGEIESGGHHHAADGCGDGERGQAKLPQLAKNQFAFDLQADNEEEDHHQAVVDPMFQ